MSGEEREEKYKNIYILIKKVYFYFILTKTFINF